MKNSVPMGSGWAGHSHISGFVASIGIGIGNQNLTRS